MAAMASLLGSALEGHSLVMETDGDRASAATPVELLLAAVGGCMGSDVVDILRKKREHVAFEVLEDQQSGQASA